MGNGRRHLAGDGRARGRRPAGVVPARGSGPGDVPHPHGAVARRRTPDRGAPRRGPRRRGRRAGPAEECWPPTRASSTASCLTSGPRRSTRPPDWSRTRSWTPPRRGADWLTRRSNSLADSPPRRTNVKVARPRGWAAVRTLAVVPIKTFDLAKQRLARALARGSRESLAQAMFADVLGALRRAERVERVAVVTADATADSLSRGLATVLRDHAQAGQS